MHLGIISFVSWISIFLSSAIAGVDTPRLDSNAEIYRKQRVLVTRSWYDTKLAPKANRDREVLDTSQNQIEDVLVLNGLPLFNDKKPPRSFEEIIIQYRFRRSGTTSAATIGSAWLDNKLKPKAAHRDLNDADFEYIRRLLSDASQDSERSVYCSFENHFGEPVTKPPKEHIAACYIAPTFVGLTYDPTNDIKH